MSGRGKSQGSVSLMITAPANMSPTPLSSASCWPLLGDDRSFARLQRFGSCHATLASTLTPDLGQILYVAAFRYKRQSTAVSADDTALAIAIAGAPTRGGGRVCPQATAPVVVASRLRRNRSPIGSIG